MLNIAAVITLAGVSALGPNPTAQTPPQTQPDTPTFQVISDTEIIADGHTFNSWNELHASGYFGFEDTRCGTLPLIDPAGDVARGGGSDCSFNRTIIQPEYDPIVAKYRIPVVVHIIQSSNGTGAMPDSRAISQIEILNEDFQALAGSNGAPGNDGQIEFYLATEDPRWKSNHRHHPLDKHHLV